MKQSINPNKLILNLNKAHGKYLSAIGDVEELISDKVEFDFSILFQDSDGFVMLNPDGSYNAPLDKCLEIIKNKGVLTTEDYLNETI